MYADIISGHGTLADWLLLIAAILFGLAALVPFLAPGPAERGPALRAALIPAGLCLVAVGFLVL